MDGTLGTELGDRQELTAAVLAELIALRGAHGKLTIEKFSQYESLRRVCGGGDLLDAFLMFERELRRYIAMGNRNEVAAAISITADSETVLDRLEKVVEHFEKEDGQSRDQRTGRRWSDQGLQTIATELVYMAEVQGRLGSELLTIVLAGAPAALHLVIWQLTTKHLEDHAPLVRFWQYRHEDIVEQSKDITYDLDRVDAPEATSAVYRLKRYHFLIELPRNLTAAVVRPGDAVYRISIEGRDAPMRTVSFEDQSDLGDDFGVRFTTYRTHATVEIVKADR